MARYQVSRKRTPLNPNFPIPPGAEEVFVYDEDFELSEGDTEDSIASDDDSDSDEDIEELSTPEEFTVIGQNARMGQDGSVVIDLIIDVEDIDGVVQYDTHVAVV
jgi:hypothetical protein